MSDGLQPVAVSQNGEHENVYEDMVWLPQVRAIEDGLESFCSALRETGYQKTDRYERLLKNKFGIEVHLSEDESLLKQIVEHEPFVVVESYPEDEEWWSDEMESGYADMPRLPTGAKIYVSEPEHYRHVNDIGYFLATLAEEMHSPVEANDDVEAEPTEHNRERYAPASDGQTEDLLGWEISDDEAVLSRRPYRVTVYHGVIGVHQGSLFSRRFDWDCSQSEKYRLLARIADKRDEKILRDFGHAELANKIIDTRRVAAITNPQKLLELSKADQEAFFEALDPSWLSSLEMAGSDDAGLNDLVEEYASNPEDYSVGGLLRTFNGNFSEERADDLDFGDGGALTERELNMLKTALKRKHERGEIESESHFTTTYDFAFNEGEYTAFLSGPLWQGSFEWELDAVQAKLRKV